MSTKISAKIKQAGFSVLAVILVCVAVIAVLGVYLMSGQGNTSAASTSGQQVIASSVMNDADAIKTQYDMLIINGQTVGTVTFQPGAGATTPVVNVFDPVGGIQYPKSNAAAFSSTTFPNGNWIYSALVVEPSKVGTGVATPMIYVFPVINSVCQQINQALYQSTTIPAPTALPTIANLGNGAGTANINAGTSSGNLDGASNQTWTQGCLQTSTANSNVYFRLLKPL